jgi:hypothetical protein
MDVNEFAGIPFPLSRTRGRIMIVGGIALENISGAGRSGLRVTVQRPIAGDNDSTPCKGAGE